MKKKTIQQVISIETVWRINQSYKVFIEQKSDNPQG